MDALRPMEQTDGFWLGRLSLALAQAARRGDVDARNTVSEFLSVPVLQSQQVREWLREELKR